jgi:hypothetical protein
LRDTIPYGWRVRKAAREGIWLPGGVNWRIAFIYKLPEKCDEIVKEI